ncbi:MAG: ribosome biogenesis GTPase YlqF [Candidatus Gastranaerophilales bacterium]|nr:ribosome biogenesis GTPase YlqF [Candidatus Gastranaerophilales bacterium]
MNNHIHWYPGHIAKAERALKEKLNLVDVILEVLDAQIPKSSSYGNTKALFKDKPRIILLNKCDLSDEHENLKWKRRIEEETGATCLLTTNGSHKDTNIIINKILDVSKPVIEKMVAKGLLPRPIRVMVAGMPNVGKSSTINRLIKKSKTKTGARAGVTRQQQWVRVHEKIELLDTPGIIPMAQPDQETALKLACVNSIGENAYDNEHVARELLRLLSGRYEKNVREYYNLENEEVTIENIALKRNWLIKDGMPDVVRCSQFILSNFRDGKIGKITLDEYGEC